jgi:hypothetical protein
MILVDLNQVLISNLMAQTRGQAEPNKDMIRHMVLNSIRGFNTKFKSEYGIQVLCSDAANPWRRDIFPHYKHSRRKGRETSSVDWENIFNIITEIKNEIKENFPYKVLHIEKCEADDIIATLVKHYHNEKVMIISGDKDFIQLQKHENVKQYSPIQKKYVGEDENPITYLHEQIIKGDRSDGIPNILSPDDVFTTEAKQSPITKKRLAEWSNMERIPLGSETLKNYERNKTLIDLTQIPEPLENEIINTYNNYEIRDRSKLFNYFMEKKLKSLIENINDF